MKTGTTFQPNVTIPFALIHLSSSYKCSDVFLNQVDRCNGCSCRNVCLYILVTVCMTQHFRFILKSNGNNEMQVGTAYICQILFIKTLKMEVYTFLKRVSIIFMWNLENEIMSPKWLQQRVKFNKHHCIACTPSCSWCCCNITSV